MKNYQFLNGNASRTIFVESQQSFSNQISLSYFIPELAQKLDARIVSYTMIKSARLSRIKENLRNRFSIYYAFGAREHYLIEGNSSGYWKEYSAQIQSKVQLECFEINGIRIGDLIYDTYLRRSKKATIDYEDRYFIEIFDECVSYFFSFSSVFSQKNVSGVCVSHCVYHFAIPLRIGIKFGIEVFQVTGESIYRLSTTNTHAYTNFKYYPELFRQITPKDSNNGVQLAKQALDYRLKGNLSVHMPYSTKSAFERTVIQSSPVITPSERVKILVAIHDFFDSPHSYGDNFFPDFLDWLEQLGEISRTTDYDWYIKTHRDPIGNPYEILEDFVIKYPKFQILDRDIDHHTIIEQGITLALTVYGTIGMEYPYLGVPVINASKNNPHTAYQFSLTPMNREEYLRILRNLENFQYEISKDQVIEYYFMTHFYQLQSLFYLNYEDYLVDVGGYTKSVGVESLKYFLNNQRRRIPDLDFVSAIRSFLGGSKFQLDRNDFSEHCKLRYWQQYD
jgi:hypothetical protein